MLFTVKFLLPVLSEWKIRGNANKGGKRNDLNTY